MNKYLFEMVGKRKSIRKFKETALGDNAINEIKMIISNLEPLYENIKFHIQIIGDKDSKSGIFNVKSPQYIAAFSENKEGYLENMGYLLQQLDLALAFYGYGACWLGMMKTKNNIEAPKSMNFVIGMAFGIPDENLLRKSGNEFTRRKLSEITDIGKLEGNTLFLEMMEAGRISPSASNSQPWYFLKEDGKLIVYRFKLNPIKVLVYNKMNQIDMGIALCHIRLAAEKNNWEIKYYKEDGDKYIKPLGYEYFITGELSENNG